MRVCERQSRNDNELHESCWCCWRNKRGGARAATAIYRNALLFAPKDEEMPPALRAPTEHAREVVAKTRRALEDHLLVARKQFYEAGEGLSFV